MRTRTVLTLLNICKNRKETGYLQHKLLEVSCWKFHVHTRWEIKSWKKAIYIRGTLVKDKQSFRKIITPEIWRVETTKGGRGFTIVSLWGGQINCCLLIQSNRLVTVDTDTFHLSNFSLKSKFFGGLALKHKPRTSN